MESLLEFAKGPLFIMTFVFMILGLARRVFLQSMMIHEAIRKLSYFDFSIWNSVKSIVEWMIPVGHIYKNRVTLNVVSFIFHVGLLVIPIFFLNHVDLWKRGLGVSWPGFSLHIADILTIITIATALYLFMYRLLNKSVRAMSTSTDYLLLIILTIPFISGYLACHPVMNPVSYTTMMVIHVLSSELVFVLLPFTKLVHCVLFVFDRVSSDLFWKMPVGAGEKVARELHGEKARV